VSSARVLLALASAALLAAPAVAQQNPAGDGQGPQLQSPPAPAQSPPAPPQSPPAAPAPTKPSDDFDLLPPEKVPDAATHAQEEETQRQLGRRRTMLQLHQAFGFATIASVGAAVVLGQLNYNDKYGGGGDTGRFRAAHGVAAYASATIFATTGVLALLAPSPFDKPLRIDTGTLHKTSMAVATAGMAAEIVLGILTGTKEGRISQRDVALAHQIIGYTTLAATTTGFLVLTF
jgi:hypothetical protein